MSAPYFLNSSVILVTNIGGAKGSKWSRPLMPFYPPPLCCHGRSGILRIRDTRSVLPPGDEPEAQTPTANFVGQVAQDLQVTSGQKPKRQRFLRRSKCFLVVDNPFWGHVRQLWPLLNNRMIMQASRSLQVGKDVANVDASQHNSIRKEIFARLVLVGQKTQQWTVDRAFSGVSPSLELFESGQSWRFGLLADFFKEMFWVFNLPLLFMGFWDVPDHVFPILFVFSLMIRKAFMFWLQGRNFIELLSNKDKV